jgi:transposase
LVGLRLSLATAELPIDPDELRAFALACQSELKVAEVSVQYKTLEIEKLKFQIAKLRRMQFGRSSERINRQIEQLELRLEELEAGEAEVVAKAEAEEETADPPPPLRERSKPKRKPLPEHLPRQEVVHQPGEDGACTCPDCGKGMAKLGEDITEVLDYVPGHFQVIRHVRPKCLHRLRCDHASPGTRHADAAPARHPGYACASSGVEVCGSLAAVSPERDLRPRGR